MNRAIISGATGLVGSSIARACNDHGIPTMQLRRSTAGPPPRSPIGRAQVFVHCDLSDRESTLGALKRHQEFVDEETVFYHCAWGGPGRLTQGSLRAQMHSASMASNAVQIAAELGCSKFVGIGSLLESILETNGLDSDSSDLTPNQFNYALAKIAARDMAKLVAYMQRINYVHTRLSVPLHWPPGGGGFVSKSIRSLLDAKRPVAAQSQAPHSIILMEDVAEAYVRIGQAGRNGADYFVAGPNVATLNEYFDAILAVVRDIDAGNSQAETFAVMGNPYRDSSDGVLSAKQLFEDTGFQASRDVASRTVLEACR